MYDLVTQVSNGDTNSIIEQIILMQHSFNLNLIEDRLNAAFQSTAYFYLFDVKPVNCDGHCVNSDHECDEYRRHRDGQECQEHQVFISCFFPEFKYFYLFYLSINP